MTSANNVSSNVSLTAALQAAGIAGIITAAINFIVYYAARLIIGGPLTANTPVGDSVGLVPVLVLSIAAPLLAGLVFWGLDRFVTNPTRPFLMIAAIVFLVFMYNPIPAAATPAIGWTLEIMHGVVAVPVILALLGLKK